MRNIGLYRLTFGETISFELRAYSEILDELFDDINELSQEGFVSTAVGYGLAAYEKMNGPEKTGTPVELRRKMIGSLININVNDNNVEGIKKFFRSLNVECTVMESPSVSDIYIRPTTNYYSEEERKNIIKRAERFLPCHLSFTIDFRSASWKSYDDMRKTFGELDGLNLTWIDFEKYEGE